MIGASIGTTENPVTPTRPVLQPVVLPATCHFDQGLCTNWTIVEGWTLYPENGSDVNALPTDGPQSGKQSVTVRSR